MLFIATKNVEQKQKQKNSDTLQKKKKNKNSISKMLLLLFFIFFVFFLNYAFECLAFMSNGKYETVHWNAEVGVVSGYFRLKISSGLNLFKTLSTTGFSLSI